MKQNTINRACRLNITLPGLFLASTLSFSVAYAAPGAFMNCREELNFKQTFDQMGAVIFYWGYRPQDGSNDKGMLTNFGMSGFGFSGNPFVPFSIMVEHHSEKVSETWMLSRIDKKIGTWGGEHEWELKKFNELTNKTLYSKIICYEYFKAPQKPKPGDLELEAED